MDYELSCGRARGRAATGYNVSHERERQLRTGRKELVDEEAQGQGARRSVHSSPMPSNIC